MTSLYPWLLLALRLALLVVAWKWLRSRRTAVAWPLLSIWGLWLLSGLLISSGEVGSQASAPWVGAIEASAPLLLLALLVAELRMSRPARSAGGAEGEIVGAESIDSEHTRAVLEATTDLVAMVDDRGKVLWLNHAGRRLLDIARGEDVRSLHIREFYGEEAFRYLTREAMPVATATGVWSGEVDLQLRDGTTRPTHHVIHAHEGENGQIEMWSTIARDMSADRKAKEALRASEAKFAAAFRHSLDSVLLTSVPAGEVLEVNRGFSLISGHPREEALGKTTRELDIWADIAERDRMFEILRRDGKIEAYEAHVRNAVTGAVRFCLIWGEIVEIDSQPMLLTVVRDCSEQKEAEAVRRRFVADLESKNQELERFSYTVAHDLKNPLLSIQGFVDLIDEDLVDQRMDDLSLYLDRIRTSATRMHRLLEDLLELSRAGRVIDSPRPVEMEALANEAVELVYAAIASRGAEVTVEAGLGMAWGDRTRLLQVFQNLVANAVKFMGDSPWPEIRIGSRVDGADKVYFVSDNGVGLDPAHHRAIFGLFDRLGTRVEGTGVGLALVERIVEIHGGRVWVESEGQGKGSTFCFTLGIGPPSEGSRTQGSRPGHPGFPEAGFPEAGSPEAGFPEAGFPEAGFPEATAAGSGSPGKSESPATPGRDSTPARRDSDSG